MGLDMSSGNVCHRMGGYSYFGNYRRELFKFFHKEDLNNMEGFGIVGVLTSEKIKTHETKSLKFADLKTQQLIPFIDHSDCDGTMTAEEAGSCIPDLKIYLDHLNNPEIEFDQKEDYIQMTKNLIEIFTESILTNQLVEFH